MRWHVAQGEPVTAGQTLATLYTDTPERFPAAIADLAGAVTVGAPEDVAEQLPLVLDRIGQ